MKAGKGKNGGKLVGLADERFKHVASDPKFGGMKRSDKKVVIEKRFAAALQDEKFSSRVAVDMRGRKVPKKKNLELHSLYELEKDEEEIKDKEDVNQEESGDENGSGADESGEEQEEGEGSEDESDDDEDEEVKVDLARGEGNMSSSDEDESGDEWTLEEQEEEHCWGQMDQDARRVEWASCRLAICNMDWDNLNCEDLFVLVSSFKPLGGAVEKLTIFLSDFGKEKLEEEDKKGPQLKINRVIENPDEMDAEAREAVRAYQMDRLKYYYAVLECDSENTASAIYEACDGIEYEMSGLKMDMRFVPDDMDFDESRIKETVTQDSVDAAKYKPKQFQNNALQCTNTKLTWDETDPNRQRRTKSAFEADADLDAVASELIANSDSEGDDEEEENSRKKALKTLLAAAGLDKKEKDMDIEWEECDSDDEEGKEMQEPKCVKKLAGQKDSDDGEKKETAWEKYLVRRKEKKKAHKQEMMKLKRAAREEAEEDARPGNRKKPKKEKKEDPSLAAAAVVDDRFKALFTDSAFTIEQADVKSKNKKNSLLQKQAELKKQRKEADATAVTKEVDLVAKLKNKAQKWKK